MRLSEINTRAPQELDKNKIKKETRELRDYIQQTQRILQAQAKYSLLVVLQGMDCSGKDGGTRSVFSGVNPSGISVYSFKKPTDLEFSHDFLWRVHAQVPASGQIKIFNRSHYEDILVPSVYGYIPKEVIDKRYELINDFEKLLELNNTKIVKIYLHLSKEEQLERLNERISMSHKFWKHNDGDWDTRDRWEDFMKVYESIFEKCNSVPWHIVPTDQNWYKEYLIAKHVSEALKSLPLNYPELETERFTEV